MRTPETTLVVECVTAEELTIVHVSGELDVATTEQFDRELANARTDHLVLDLADLVFLDSTGIGALVLAARAAYERGGSLRIENVTGMPRRVLVVSGVYERLAEPAVYGDSPWAVEGVTNLDAR